jgi:hypothetical protein
MLATTRLSHCSAFLFSKHPFIGIVVKANCCQPQGRVMEGDAAYFSRRAIEQSEAAANAEHPKAREAHLELAARYAELAEAIAANDNKAEA